MLQQSQCGKFITDNTNQLGQDALVLLTPKNIRFLSQFLLNKQRYFIAISQQIVSKIQQDCADAKIYHEGQEDEYCKDEDGASIKVYFCDKHQEVNDFVKNYYNYDCKFICVTGTNGKTSVVSWVRQFLSTLGHNTIAVESTVCYFNNQRIENIYNILTTPSICTMFQLIWEVSKHSKVEFCVFENSSHALHQNRTQGIQIASAGFTNLSLDHLDYHKTLQEYFDVKKTLFTKDCNSQSVAVLNADVKEFEELKSACMSNNVKVTSYGKQNADFVISDIKQDKNLGFSVENQGVKYHFSLNCFGSFQAYNAVCAIGLIMAAGVSVKSIAKLQNTRLCTPLGRMQEVINSEGKGTNVFIDYAHTPDAIKTVLTDVRGIVGNKAKIITIFGCGGNRDSSKRAEMGEVTARLSNLAIITNDNPRNEDELSIVNEVAAGAKGYQYKIITDRKSAIDYGIAQKGSNDIVIIAGKGIENY